MPNQRGPSRSGRSRGQGRGAPSGQQYLAEVDLGELERLADEADWSRQRYRALSAAGRP